VIGGKFYVMGEAGGADHSGKLSVYDPATNQWTVKTPLGLGRYGAGTAVLGDKLYVMGGWRADRGIVDVTIVYDPVTDTWTRRAPLPSPRSGTKGTTILLNGKPRIELVGGLPGLGDNLQYIP